MQIKDKKVLNCNECEFKKMFDYGNRIYYCDNEDRGDDIGKLGVGELPERSPKWLTRRKSWRNWM